MKSRTIRVMDDGANAFVSTIASIGIAAAGISAKDGAFSQFFGSASFGNELVARVLLWTGFIVVSTKALISSYEVYLYFTSTSKINHN